MRKPGLAGLLFFLLNLLYRGCQGLGEVEDDDRDVVALAEVAEIARISLLRHNSVNPS